MIPLSITPNLELNPWEGLDGPRPVIDGATLERIGLLPNGTAAGKAVVGMVVRLPDGTPVIVQTTWALFQAAARALAASPVAQMEDL